MCSLFVRGGAHEAGKTGSGRGCHGAPATYGDIQVAAVVGCIVAAPVLSCLALRQVRPSGEQVDRVAAVGHEDDQHEQYAVHHVAGAAAFQGIRPARRRGRRARRRRRRQLRSWFPGDPIRISGEDVPARSLASGTGDEPPATIPSRHRARASSSGRPRWVRRRLRCCHRPRLPAGRGRPPRDHTCISSWLAASPYLSFPEDMEDSM
jgi:hypothetical protein